VWLGYFIAASFICLTGRIGATYHIGQFFGGAAISLVNASQVSLLSVAPHSVSGDRSGPSSTVRQWLAFGTACSPGSEVNASPS